MLMVFHGLTRRPQARFHYLPLLWTLMGTTVTTTYTSLTLGPSIPKLSITLKVSTTRWTWSPCTLPTQQHTVHYSQRQHCSPCSHRSLRLSITAILVRRKLKSFCPRKALSSDSIESAQNTYQPASQQMVWQQLVNISVNIMEVCVEAGAAPVNWKWREWGFLNLKHGIKFVCVLDQATLCKRFLFFLLSLYIRLKYTVTSSTFS